MSHAVGQSDLDRLPVKDGFRLRGEAITRLETFVDAAFAFAVTLLVVSFGQVPGTFDELMSALKRIPAFLAGFAILMSFWASHNRFSRRFGLEDFIITVISLAIVAMVLIYIFPLRILMSSTMAFFTAGWVPSELRVQTLDQLRAIYIIYGAGFFAMAGLVAGMYAHALRCAVPLRLNAIERHTAVAERNSNLLLAASALISISFAAFLPMHSAWQQAMPGMSYGILAFVMPWYGRRVSQRNAQLQTESALATR